jgi:hypothetical protein
MDDRKTELDSQVATLVDLGYPALLELSADAFADQLAPLHERAAALRPVRGHEHIPFVLVLRDVLSPHQAITHTRLGREHGFTSMEADDVARFRPVDDIALPAGWAYLLTDVDTGAATRDVPPAEALDQIKSAGRTTLTLDEGIALVLHNPDLLRVGNRFSMLGSRCGDRRVPAIWVSEGRPRLGWCWEGAPHTWLGSASAAGRLGS